MLNIYGERETQFKVFLNTAYHENKTSVVVKIKLLSIGMNQVTNGLTNFNFLMNVMQIVTVMNI